MDAIIRNIENHIRDFNNRETRLRFTNYILLIKHSQNFIESHISPIYSNDINNRLNEARELISVIITKMIDEIKLNI